MRSKLFFSTLSSSLYKSLSLPLLCISSLACVPSQAAIKVVVDNQSSGFSTTGDWYESGASSEYLDSSVYAMDDATATWTATLPESGIYRVQVWWSWWDNRGTSVPYTINHKDGQTVKRKNQQNTNQSGRWVSLGKYSFDAGDATISVTREPWDEVTTSADAVRFVKLEDLPTLPDPVDLSELDLIRVDQLGYQPGMRKIAVLANPKVGFNVPSTAYNPATTLEIRNVSDDLVVWSGAPSSWNNGATDPQSGDQVWHLDFTSLSTPGSYYIYDPDNQISSHPFEINADVYLETLKAATRTYFYQRVSADKLTPYADSNWADTASHSGLEQDSDCRAMNASDPTQSDPATSLDLSGGWYDAGDFNKYVNFADGVVHELLFAYEENPLIWGDDWNLPESGNQIPDLLDEVRYELDWLLRMQQGNGGVLHKVASISWDFSAADPTLPPSQDAVPRRYAPVTASATISAAGAFAHAARVYTTLDPAYSLQLKNAALSAWQWLENNPSQIPSSFDNAGFVNVAAEDSSYDQTVNRFNAAVYLYAATGDASFQSYISAHSSDARLLSNDAYLLYDGMDYESQNALLYYTSLSNADATLVASIESSFNFNLSNPWVDFAPKLQMDDQTDGYLSYLDAYSWGSNRAKGQAANSLIGPAVYSFSAVASELEQDASQFLHYLHGVNPMGQFYLSNMGSYGAEQSVDQFYHLWFRDGSLWDSSVDSYGPPPGFLVGGANEHYDVTGVPMSDSNTADIASQPAAKKYRSWNTLGDAQVYDHESYRISENSITYQAAYIRLLSKFVQ